MNGRNTMSGELTAILIAPNGLLANQFSVSQSQCRSFQILSEMRSYPTVQSLEIRMRQMRPHVVLLDVSSDASAAAKLIHCIAEGASRAQVIALSLQNDSEVLLNCLRQGASEFLCAPFDPVSQQEAVSRLRKLIQPEPVSDSSPGTVLSFCSAKPGSGASTIAMQTAFTIRNRTGKRVLLADFDLKGGSLGLFCKTKPDNSFQEALGQNDQIAPLEWSNMVVEVDGVDVLAGPEIPYYGGVDSRSLTAAIDLLRRRYDFIVIDVPVIFERVSLMVMSHSDRVLLVLTPELATLYLARKALQLIDHLGFPRDRFWVLINRLETKQDLSLSDMQKLFGCPVHETFPNDFVSAVRMATLGRPGEMASDLGAAVQNFAGRLTIAPSVVEKQVAGL